MKILGIDFGLSKIGLAMAEDGFVEPIITLRNQSKFIQKIARFCEENKIEKVVVGVSEGLVGNRAKSFAQELAARCGLAVDFQDETLTTKEAVAKMIAIGRGKKARKQKEDAYAAACILEEYLAERRKNV